MKIAVLTTDNREHYGTYQETAPHFGTAPEALLQGFAMLPNLEIHVLSCAQEPMQSPSKLADRVWFHGLHVPQRGWMRTAYLGCSRAIRRRLRQIQPDIVHGQGTERECAISAVRSGFPNVLTIHGNMRLIAQVNHAKVFSFAWLAGKLEARTIPRSRGVVCITRYTQQAVADLARRTWVVPNAVDASFFEVKPQPESSRMVLCVGNISFRKNQNPFIQALDGWAEANKVKIVFLGQAQKDSAYVAEFFQLIESRPWCVYGGFADRARLKEYLQRASLLALPSLEDNCPMVVLEAMAANVPVLAAKVGGLPDLIVENKTGFFCDPQNAKSMRSALEQALMDDQRASTTAHQARHQAQERFHPRVIAQRHLEIYREVLSNER